MIETRDVDLIEIGYSWLLKKLNIDAITPFRLTFVTLSGRGSTQVKRFHEVAILPKTYALSHANNPVHQLAFAIKHEGVNLDIIRGCFDKISPEDIVAYVKETPTGKNPRIIWFLYEYLMGKKLKLDDVKSTPYVDVLDPKKYYVSKAEKSKRHAVNNNLLGTPLFCPLVRKTAKIEKYIKKDLSNKTKILIDAVDPSILSRATNYLYTKETKSSFGIEKIKPDISRTNKFVNLLENVIDIPNLSKEVLISLQNAIVDEAYQDTDYRQNQNYVGELTNTYQQKVHYISPKPENIAELMSSYLKCATQLLESSIHSVIIAAVLSFGFVFLHPFEDGNGRIHRFIIHYVLSKTGFTPNKMIFPVSAVMLKNMRQYDEMLELFSKPLLRLVTNYEMSDEGELTVHSETKIYYQYIDYTNYVEYLFSCIEETIRDDFQEELTFIENYDKTKLAIQQIVDMPDIKIDRIIRCIAQNNGVLGKKMKKNYFSELSNENISAIEQVIQKEMLNR